MVKFDDSKLLRNIYRHPQLMADHLFDEASCKTFCSYLEEYCQAVIQKRFTMSGLTITDEQVRALKYAAKVLKDELNYVRWYPEYGCVMVQFENEFDHFADTITLEVLGLDSHRFELHGTNQHTSQAMDFVSLYVGTATKIETQNKILPKFEAIFKTAVCRSNEKRSAAGGKQGHQKTPAFIHTLAMQAFQCECSDKCICSPMSPQGGFTDCGLHTGGKRKDTCWPLVLALFQWSLRHQLPSSADFECLNMINFDLFILENIEECVDEYFTIIPIIIKSAALKAFALGRDGHDGIDQISNRLASSQGKLESSFSKWAEDESEKYVLPNDLSYKSIRSDFHHLCIRPPLPQEPQADAESMSDRRVRAMTNINFIETINVRSHPVGFNQMMAWVKQAKQKLGSNTTSMIVFLRSVESFLWCHVLKGEGLSGACQTEDDMKSLMNILDDYRDTVFKLKDDVRGLMVVKEQSRELLVCWTIYCMIFDAIKRNHEKLMRFTGVPLKFQDLRVLVLSEKPENEVLKKVALFLSQNYRGDEDALFHLTHQSATLKFAECYSRIYFKDIYNEAKVDANYRIDRHWIEVERKKELAQRLRRKLEDLEEKLREREAEETIAIAENWRRHTEYMANVNKAKQRVHSARNLVERSKQVLRNAEKAPSAVIQPLPKDESQAYCVLFFLHMPITFRYLSRLTMTCQQMLVPRPWMFSRGGTDGNTRVEVDKLLKHGPSTLTWHSYYVQHQHYYDAPMRNRGIKSDDAVTLKCTSNCPALSKIGPFHIEQITSKLDGIWYPDSLGMVFSWNGGPKSFDWYDSDKTEFNPFKISLYRYLTINYYTEETLNSKLQWFLSQPGFDFVERTRSNKTIALQDFRNRPEWLAKVAYFHFGRMRAYPNTMLRNLVTSLHEQGLPLDNEDVKKLIQMTVFQVGDIVITNENVIFQWKTDLFTSNDLLSCFYVILSGIVNTLRESPTSYRSLATVGELLSFCLNTLRESPTSYRSLATVGELLSFCLNVGSINHDMIEKYNGLIEQSARAMIEFAGVANRDCLENTENIDAIPCLRTKVALLYYEGILILARAPLKYRNVQLIIECMVKASNFFIDTESPFFEELQCVRQLCRESLSLQLENVVQLCLSDNGNILTKALKSSLAHTPEKLSWNIFKPDTSAFSCCFESISGDCLFSINVLDGTVLVDGCPISLLPAEITNHSLYMRTFGNENNFEAIRNNGVYKTIHPVGGNRYYSFQISNGILTIKECQEQNEIELLDNTTVNNWGHNLPKRYKEMHSYWIDRTRQMIFVRGIHFKDNIISSFILYQGDNLGGENAHCLVVPEHDLCDSLTDSLRSKLPSYKRLLVGESRVVDILSKFENKALIHVVEEPTSDCLYFEFPRYKLSFELKNGVLSCLEIIGFELCNFQQLRDTLVGFRNYLLLRRSSNSSLNQSNAEILITPDRLPFKKKELLVVLEENTSCGDHQSFFQYEFHSRLQYLTARDICARLHLAGLHLSTTMLVCDPLLSMTGEERAIQLIRQCYSTRPLDNKVAMQIDGLKILSKPYPSILLLLFDLERNADSLTFLYSKENNIDIDSRKTSSYTNFDVFSAYKSEKQNYPVNYRRLLTHIEEKRCLGTHVCTFDTRIKSSHNKNNICHVDSNSVKRMEVILKRGKCKLENVTANLSNLIAPKIPRSNLDNFTFDGDSTETKLEEDIFDELKRSWYCHQSTLQFVVQQSDAFLYENMLRLNVTATEKEVREYLLAIINEQTVCNKLLHDTNCIPKCSITDLISLACDKCETLKFFNPVLTAREYCEKIYDLVLLWMQICVLQDKLERLTEYARNIATNRTGESQYMSLFIQEVSVDRKWSVHEYPYWLAFEVEGRLQIRPEQYAIAHHLLKNPGNIMQLNMGLGKTRVILPMIILHQTETNRENLVRVHLLSSLFDEAYEYLHNNLCASILLRRVYTLPFNRDIQLSHTRIRTLVRMIKRLKSDKGFLLVTPESRLSLELKQKELFLFPSPGSNEELSTVNKEVSIRLREDINCKPWYNIFDESDELLHHRFQLIYAVGSVQNLPNGAQRWQCCQTILNILYSKEFIAFMKSRPLSVNIDIHEKETHRLPTICFTNNIDSAAIIAELNEKLMKHLEENAPNNLSWMKHMDKEMKLEVTKAITDPKYDPLLLRETFSAFTDVYYQDVLALRGFLGQQIVFHCMQNKRNRVDFGIARGNYRQKRLAVPFRGADNPSDRAEYSHPDVAICLTTIAYYDDGLTKQDVREAFEALMKLSKNGQNVEYNDWYLFSLQTKRFALHEGNSIDAIEKIDLTNVKQLEQLFRWFHRNMKTINFWLNYCVFPSDMQQFPERVTGNAWHLSHVTGTSRSSCVGFSGTNDNHRLLPLQVTQYFPSNEKSGKVSNDNDILNNLFATNGKMLDVISRSTCDFIEKDNVTLECLLDSIVSKGCSALIDCGAILAGRGNSYFAQQLANKLSSHYKGIAFYEDGWKIRDMNGVVKEKSLSPINDESLFVLFDEPRCRGSDFKLPFSAVALITLGPNITKDKLMQGAGRMRQLERGQKIVFIYGQDISTQIGSSVRNSFNTDVRDILRWVMKNTVEQNKTSLLTWCGQGLLYASEEKNVQNIIRSEYLTLDELYGQPSTDNCIPDVAKLMYENTFGQAYESHSKSNEIDVLVGRTIERTRQFGEGYICRVLNNCDEECERELELQDEEEHEREIEIPSQLPRNEEDWNYDTIFLVEDAVSLGSHVKRLDYLLSSCSESFAKVNWPCNLYCTENFFFTLERASHDVRNYLRLVDAYLYFHKSKHVLLISERESHCCLEQFWKHRNSTLNVTFHHYSFTKNRNNEVSCDNELILSLPSKRHFMDIKSATALKLFAGDTNFQGQKKILEGLLDYEDVNGNNIDATSLVSGWIGGRGHTLLYPYSDLEETCKEINERKAFGSGDR